MQKLKHKNLMDIHIAELFLNAKEQILENSEYSPKHKIKALFNLLTTILEEVTQEEKIVFTTLYSRAAFIANRFKVDSRLMFLLHVFRRKNERMNIGDQVDQHIRLGTYVIEEIIDCLWHNKDNPRPPSEEIEVFFNYQAVEVLAFKPVIEAVLVSIDIDSFSLRYYDESDASVLKTALFDQAGKNELFNEDIKLINRSFELPIHVNFIDVEIINQDTCIPQGLVLRPDYLMDVTAIANCFKDYGSNAMLRLIARFKQIENSIPLMVGNIANMFLDEIISDPEIKFNSLIPKIFRLDPLGACNLDDHGIRELIDNAKKHYLNLKKAVATELPAQGIRRDKIFLEPSFYSRDYGLQGRLDLFHYDEKTKQFDIVELKSGKPFRANVYGLTASHYTQTLLYDLMIKSSFGRKYKPNNYILYSKLNERSLKYAPPLKSQQYEAMKVRNHLIAIENKLSRSSDDAEDLFKHLTVSNYEKVMGFELKDLERFEKFYKRLKNHERDYFNSFSSFISREHQMSKTGEHGINKSNGLAALWLENVDEKEDRFSILKELTIAQNNSKEDPPTLILDRNQMTSTLANFRQGDIAVLYPGSADPRAVLKNQIFKCTIVRIDQKEIEVKLRSKQYNDSLFQSIDYWNIESDSLDSGFNTLYRSLFEFCNSSQDKKDLFMGVRPPRLTEERVHEAFEELTDEQNAILNEMTDTRDYYLLWGPPGTGKTSVMLKSLVQRLHTHTDEKILLLAYTNKAVDEICNAVESIGESFNTHYIRIGSRTGCNPRYRHRLLDNLISTMHTRTEIKSLINEKKIFISTVSSIISKVDLFKLITFDRVIVDEASQILEPMILGLLSRIEKSVLIGDHKQLPAVVTQRASASLINSEKLQHLGISDMRMSLFERLYHRCRQENWQHALGLLSYQGRMHRDVMRFPNQYFYHNNLHILPGLSHLKSERDWKYASAEQEKLGRNRFIYVPTAADLAFNWKTNVFEVEAVVRIIHVIVDIFKYNKLEFENKTLGIITPYRAQIATIRKSMEDHLPHLLDKISIDTVERYQGGARDIVLLSLCTNKLSQLKSLVSLSSEGIDRKLNVAMTRAREQLIVFGNEDILSSNKTYKALIKSACHWGRITEKSSI